MDKTKELEKRQDLHTAIRTMEHNVTKKIDYVADNVNVLSTDVAVLSNKVENVSDKQDEVQKRYEKLFNTFYTELKETGRLAYKNETRIMNNRWIFGVLGFSFTMITLFFSLKK